MACTSLRLRLADPKLYTDFSLNYMLFFAKNGHFFRFSRFSGFCGNPVECNYLREKFEGYFILKKGLFLIFLAFENYKNCYFIKILPAANTFQKLLLPRTNEIRVNTVKPAYTTTSIRRPLV